ncbi:hypothetical protein HAX54_052286 [Datura stramonium]|uniref:C2H2-type domain-containing protein n=1 Tax=Datura stramonium TaxID=4076 RepID=A0ABS8SZH3_DATST|nr:hypothetical protein [Datura stramonium]
MDNQDLITNQGIWCYRCRTCSEVFTSTQGLAGHQRKHMFQGTWVRGAPHDKFFCPSAQLPTLYRQLGNRMSTPTVSCGQGRFNHPRPKKPMVQGPHRLLGRPQAMFDPSQQQAMAREPPRPQVFLFGIQLNPNVALAAGPLKSSALPNTVTLTAEWMGRKEINEDEEGYVDDSRSLKIEKGHMAELCGPLSRRQSPQIFATVVFFSSFNEISVMPHQIQGQTGQQGMWMYQCIHCKKNFGSSQAIAGHTKGHFRDGWVKGTPQSKVFVLFSDYQPHLDSTTDSSIPEQQILARLRARLTREEQEVISRLLDSAMEQAKQSSKKSTDVEVIPTKDSEAALAIGTINRNVVSLEDSDDESKNM